MKDRVILFPEENRKLKYFKNDEIYPRLKDTENTQDTMATHPRQRRSNKRTTTYGSSATWLRSGWTSWGRWSPCSQTCGSGGVQTRRRFC